MQKKGFLKYLLFIIVFPVLLEVFVFNFRYWESRKLENCTYTLKIGEGIEAAGEEQYRVISNDNAWLELADINTHVQNLYLNMYAADVPVGVGDRIGLKIEGTDAGNSRYLQLPETEVVFGVRESYYKRVYFVGESEKIRINILNYEGRTFKIQDMKINEARPFLFHLKRLVLVMLLFALLVVFQPGSAIYKKELNWKDNRNKAIILTCILLHCLVFSGIGLVFSDSNWENDSWKANLQYNYLADSFLKGHVYLDFDPPEALKNMENPYDYAARSSILNESGEEIIMDLAYFDGKYYSYFGVVPAVFFYVPYLYLTGHQLSTAALLIFLANLFVITAFWFLYTVIKKYFNSTSLGMYLLLSALLIASSEITYCVQMPSLYSLPILLGLLLDLAGITCWMKAVDKEENVRKRWLVMGAACIALVMGCRPQLAIAVLFAFPIFLKQIKERKFFSIKGIVNTLSVFIPFIVVGIGIMIYNNMRFSSPFDFGATYNLTGFDMTHRGIIPDRFWLGIYEYFFQPFQMSARFPYFYTHASHMGLGADYQGQIINEPLLGSFFAFNLIGVFLLAIGSRNVRSELKNRGLLSFTIAAIAFGITIVATDIQMVGMTLRYLTDFSMFLMIAVVLILLVFIYKDGKSRDRDWHSIIVLFCAWCIIINYITLMAGGRYNNLPNASPTLFYQLKYLMCVR